MKFKQKYECVDCGKMKPRALVMFEDCEKCEHHGGTKLIQPGNEENGIPATMAVICHLPTRKQIHTLLGGIEDGP